MRNGQRFWTSWFLSRFQHLCTWNSRRDVMKIETFWVVNVEKQAKTLNFLVLVIVGFCSKPARSVHLKRLKLVVVRRRVELQRWVNQIQSWRRTVFEDRITQHISKRRDDGIRNFWVVDVEKQATTLNFLVPVIVGFCSRPARTVHLKRLKLVVARR